MPCVLCDFGDGQRADLAHGRRIEVQRAAAGERVAVIGDHEIAHVLGQLEFGARQHDALRGVAVDEFEQGRDVLHGGLADLDVFVRNRGVLDAGRV